MLDARDRVLWSSGRTNANGMIVDQRGTPIAGEQWWRPDCSARINPAARAHQPHFQVITRQDQAQIYEELVAKPPDVAAPVCGIGAKPAGELTTSFLSLCAKVKDNRLLPVGFLPLAERTQIAEALGADHHLAEEVAPVAVGDDPDYRTGGGRHRDLPRPACAVARRAGGGARDALLSGDAAVLSAGSLLHVAAARTPRGSTTSPAGSTSRRRRSRTGSCRSDRARGSRIP